MLLLDSSQVFWKCGRGSVLSEATPQAEDIVTEDQKSPRQTGHAVLRLLSPATMTAGVGSLTSWRYEYTKDLPDTFGAVHTHEHCVCKDLRYTR